MVLNFHSNKPVSHKRGCIKALFSRLHTHCSTPVARKAEQAYLYKMLQSSGYPINFIRQATCPPRCTTTTSNEPEKAPPTIWRSLFYIQGVSESVARRLNSNNVKIVHKPHSALRSRLVHAKTPSQPYSGAKSSAKSHARVATRLTLDKQAAFSEQGSKNTEALSGGTIQTRVFHYIAWTQATTSTGRTPVSLDLPTIKGHVNRSKTYIRENTA